MNVSGMWLTPEKKHWKYHFSMNKSALSSDLFSLYLLLMKEHAKDKSQQWVTVISVTKNAVLPSPLLPCFLIHVFLSPQAPFLSCSSSDSRQALL